MHTSISIVAASEHSSILSGKDTTILLSESSNVASRPWKKRPVLPRHAHAFMSSIRDIFNTDINIFVVADIHYFKSYAPHLPSTYHHRWCLLYTMWMQNDSISSDTGSAPCSWWSDLAFHKGSHTVPPKWDRSIEIVCNRLNSGALSTCRGFPKGHMECWMGCEAFFM